VWAGGAAARGASDEGSGLGAGTEVGTTSGAWPTDSIVEVARSVHTTGFALPVVAKAANATTPATATASAAGAKRKGPAGALDID
jgi:hypothetical protein